MSKDTETIEEVLWGVAHFGVQPTSDKAIPIGQALQSIQKIIERDVIADGGNAPIFAIDQYKSLRDKQTVALTNALYGGKR